MSRGKGELHLHFGIWVIISNKKYMTVIVYKSKNILGNLKTHLQNTRSFVCCLVTRSKNCSMPGFPVLHHLLELAQTLVHWVSDAIQLCHPLSSPSPAFNLSQHQGLFQWVSSLHQVAKVLELQLHHCYILTNEVPLISPTQFHLCPSLC